MREKLLFAKDFSLFVLKAIGCVLLGAALGGFLIFLCATAAASLGFPALVLGLAVVLLLICAWSYAAEQAKKRAGRARGEQMVHRWRPTLD